MTMLGVFWCQQKSADSEDYWWSISSCNVKVYEVKALLRSGQFLNKGYAHICAGNNTDSPWLTIICSGTIQNCDSADWRKLWSLFKLTDLLSHVIKMHSPLQLQGHCSSPTCFSPLHLGYPEQQHSLAVLRLDLKQRFRAFSSFSHLPPSQTSTSTLALLFRHATSSKGHKPWTSAWFSLWVSSPQNLPHSAYLHIVFSFWGSFGLHETLFLEGDLEHDFAQPLEPVENM